MYIEKRLNTFGAKARAIIKAFTGTFQIRAMGEDLLHGGELAWALWLKILGLNITSLMYKVTPIGRCMLIVIMHSFKLVTAIFL